MSDEYDVGQYTEEQLLSILNLKNPSDRELEAKIISMIRKYQRFGNDSGDKLAKFFEDIYEYFFEDTESQEGFETMGASPLNVSQASATIQTVSKESVVEPAADNLQLTRPLDYSKDNLNPLLKQTIKRIISIDSQYRDQKKITSASNFTFNLSEPLKDVVALSLYSVQIPYTWYTVNSDFGGNFFYLKGNAPGIDNGNHDYKISVPSGNYNAVALSAAVNASIQQAISEYTDVSFGNTKLVYNNGLASDSGTGKCALQVDITKIFNECNYSLYFPNWSSPIIAASGDNAIKKRTIAGYFGFNNQSYYCSAIYSEFIPFLKTSNNIPPFIVNTQKTSFKIIPYVGNSYLTATSVYSPVVINLGLVFGSQLNRETVVNSLNTILVNNTSLDPNPTFTGCQWIDVTNPAQTGNGKSYIQIKSKLKNGSMSTIPNLKLAVVFDSDVNSIFYGSNSIFYFPNTVVNASGDVICELNELLAETPILQTNYTSNGDYILFKCIAGGPNVFYDDPKNNYQVDIPNGTYTIYTYIAAANSAIINHTSGFYSTGGSATNVTFQSNGEVTIKTSINTTFTNVNYKISTDSQVLRDIFGLPDINAAIDIPANASFFNPSYKFPSNGINITAGSKIIIEPTGNFGNRAAPPFEIVFGGGLVSNNTGEAADLIQQKIIDYTDALTGLKPFYATTVSFDSKNQNFTLFLRINLNLSQQFYKLVLYSGSSTLRFWDLLGFDSSYNLLDASNTNYVITSKNKAQGNQMTIDASNNTFQLYVDGSVDGLQTGGNIYSIFITIPDTSIDGTGTLYSIQDLINETNKQLTNNPISKGTQLYLISSANGENYVKFRFNINKIFTTKDYRLVFYDPYSFTACHSMSKNGSNTAQNATWDSTLGWILGYRDEIEYKLSDYSTTYPSYATSPPTIFYYSDYPNVFVIYGDTAVNTNLYNYFLIMLDDYVQNHLNDGLVTITSQETVNVPGPYIYACDPTNGRRIAVPADYGSPGVTYTQAELNAFNQKVKSTLTKLNSYSTGPFVQDIFGILPIKTSGLKVGDNITESNGSLQLQQRIYFGPVNIHRMTIRLLNDRGNSVDLNGVDWSFSLLCEQLYKNGTS